MATQLSRIEQNTQTILDEDRAERALNEERWKKLMVALVALDDKVGCAFAKMFEQLDRIEQKVDGEPPPASMGAVRFDVTFGQPTDKPPEQETTDGA